ncbi:MAG TPA: recombinase family protein [Planctomycetota bacterium]|jgi:DNA invertase Pin-like site-specific DNA recombinase
MKRFIAWARVSSNEQELRGHSLDVQEKSLRDYVAQLDGEMVRMFRVAESAQAPGARKIFREMLDFARQNAAKLNGIVIDRVDRASRNIYDGAALLELRDKHKLKIYFASQDLDLDTSEGEMLFTFLLGIARFDNRKKAEVVVASMRKRVESGLFVGKAPYGYENYRTPDERSLVRVNPDEAPQVRQIFELFAFHHHTLASLQQRLCELGIIYKPDHPDFPLSQVYDILTQRSYIGEIFYLGQWYPGKQEPLVQRSTFDRVQTLLGGCVYRSHQMTYASELITCGHCGRPITGELKTRSTKKGLQEYQYYRCCNYNKAGHPRIRVTEQEIDQQVLGLFDQIHIEDEEVRGWIVDFLKTKAGADQQANREKLAQLQRQETRLAEQENELLQMRISREITPEQYAEQATRLRDRAAAARLQIEACGLERGEIADLAVKAFELSQNLRAKWLTADYAEKRTLLEIVCLNFSLTDGKLCAAWRKPFDVLAETAFVGFGIPIRI